MGPFWREGELSANYLYPKIYSNPLTQIEVASRNAFLILILALAFRTLYHTMSLVICRGKGIRTVTNISVTLCRLYAEWVKRTHSFVEAPPT